jgi:phosphatidylinositol-3-phosphatase
MPLLRACLLLALSIVSAAAAAGGAAPHPIDHVFVIVLENQGYEATFGPSSPAPYLARTLPRAGVLLTQYFGTGHFSLDNYLAMISGQAASPETRDDCEVFAEFVSSGTAADGQAIGRGCVYPAWVQTLPDQLVAVHKTWRGYMEDMGNDPAREASTCGHPALGAADPTQAAQAPSAQVPAGDQYAARHDPFVYFHSIIDSPACAANVVNLERLTRDLASQRTTPNFVFISPNLCHDGHDAPCKNGQPGGLRSADAFLRKWVPLILSSPAYRHAGLLVITFDEGDAEVVPDSTGGKLVSYAGEKCCNQQPGPNLAPFPQTVREREWTIRFRDFGGDRVGAVLLSPFLQGGAVSTTPFNHYSLLKTLEDGFGTKGHLGYAGQAGLVGFFEPASDVAALRRAPR